MTKPSPLAAVRRLVSLRERPQRGEDGFILLESIVAISLITIVMGALASFTINAVSATTELRARQGAVQVATSTMAMVGSLPAGDLVTGRDQSSSVAQVSNATLTSQFGSSGAATVRSLLTSMTTIFDGSPTGTGATAVLPTSPVRQTINNVIYETSIYLGRCFLRTPGSTSSSGNSTDCVATGSGAEQLRVVVVVAWSNKACRGGGCRYTTATLINAAPDPVFNSNRANPPSMPVVANPGDQVNTVDRPESLQLMVQQGTGLDPHTWTRTAGALPAGLTLASDGLISGTPTVRGGPTSVTVTVTDVFGRTAEATFRWTIVNPPTIGNYGNLTTQRGQAVGGTLPFSCDNLPCTWSATGVPPGITYNATTGAASGAPNTSGTYTVTVLITDRDGASASTTFTWTVFDPPTIGAVGRVITTQGVNTNVELPYTCGYGTCTITLTGSVPGLGLSATSGRSGANPTTTLTVPTGSGRVHISGTVAATAVPSGRSSQTYTVTARIGDAAGLTATSSNTWTATTATLVNYAIGRSTSQSSLFEFAGSEKAVDGNTDGIYRNGSVSHTQDQSQPWWQVDLGAVTTVRTVQLFNRTDCCTERLADGIVFLSNTDMRGRSYAQLIADPAVTELPFSDLSNPSLALSANDVKARFVLVQISGTNPLHLAEVQVLGPNLAAGKATAQSTTNYNGNPSRAVDGNTDGVYNNNSVSHTDFRSQSWWQVDLGASVAVDAITVWNRTDCCADRLNGAVLLLSDTDFGNKNFNQLNADNSITKITFGSTAPRTTLAITRTARFIRIQLPGTTGNEVVSLAEVQVNGAFP